MDRMNQMLNVMTINLTGEKERRWHCQSNYREERGNGFRTHIKAYWIVAVIISNRPLGTSFCQTNGKDPRPGREGSRVLRTSRGRWSNLAGAAGGDSSEFA